jgi:hypothetical protein
MCSKLERARMSVAGHKKTFMGCYLLTLLFNLSGYTSEIIWNSSSVLIKNDNFSQFPLAHTCNPSYLGVCNQEDHGLRSGQAGSSQDPISANNSAWWCTPVILNTWEAEIGRILVPDPAWAKRLQDVISMGKGCVWCHLPVISATVGSLKQEDCGPIDMSKASPYLQNNQSKRAAGVTKVIEQLPSKRKALSSNSSTASLSLSLSLSQTCTSFLMSSCSTDLTGGNWRCRKDKR